MLAPDADYEGDHHKAHLRAQLAVEGWRRRSDAACRMTLESDGSMYAAQHPSGREWPTKVSRPEMISDLAGPPTLLWNPDQTMPQQATFIDKLYP